MKLLLDVLFILSIIFIAIVSVILFHSNLTQVGKILLVVLMMGSVGYLGISFVIVQEYYNKDERT